MPTRLSDRIKEAQHSTFVGREEEKALFRSLIADESSSVALLYLFGQGGIGKTSLLGEFANELNQLGVLHATLDARYIQSSPIAFEGALAHAVGAATPEEAFEIIGAEPRFVLMIDTFEMLSSLDDWLRRVFIPALPSNVFIVLVSRQRPSTAWRADPIWAALCVERQLENLSRAEQETFLRGAKIPDGLFPRAEQLTHGHPLALTLLVDTFAQSGDIEPSKEGLSNVIESLLERFLEGVQDPIQREALEVCALARVTTESLLAEVINNQKAAELFRWLRSLSFIETGPFGLFPHELARDAFSTEIQWRNPDLHAQLHARLRRYYAERLDHSHGAAQQSLLFDYIFLHRSNPVVKPFFAWGAEAMPYLDAMRPSDLPALTAMVERLEGPASAAAFTAIGSASPQAVVVVSQGAAPQPIGFMSCLSLASTEEDWEASDPGVAAFRAALEINAPLRDGERALLFRHWMTNDHYQDVSPGQSQIFVNVIRMPLATAGTAVSALVCRKPNQYEPMLAYGAMRALPGADFELDGHAYGVYIHDWRALPPRAWLDLLSRQEVLHGAPEAEGAVEVGREAVILSRPSFERALNEALRSMSNLPRLTENPLLKSRLMLNLGRELTGEELRKVILGNASELQQTPKDTKLFQALDTSYFRPLPSQEKAAEHLDVSIATYRRHLKAGVQRLTDLLWQKETGR